VACTRAGYGTRTRPNPAFAGVPVLAIQHLLGHTSLGTTTNYLRRLGVRLDMQRVIRGEDTV
jgi:integrase